MIASLHDMKSGECRWIGRHDLHVYCWAPLDKIHSDDGRPCRYVRRPSMFKLWTDDAGSVWDATGWTTAAEVARMIRGILAHEVAA